MICIELSHHKFIGNLGGGEMGMGFKAEDTQLCRNVALKFLPKRFVENRQDPGSEYMELQ